jgi:hypothetical protein
VSEDYGDESLKNSQQKIKIQEIKFIAKISETHNSNNDLSFDHEFDIDEDIDSDFEKLDKQIASIYSREARSMNLHNI